MKKILMTMAAGVLATSTIPSISNTFINQSTNLNKKNVSDTNPIFYCNDYFYLADNYTSNVKTLAQWKTGQVRDWNSFINRKTIISFDNSYIAVGLDNQVNKYISHPSDLTSKITTNPNHTLSFVVQYFSNATNYTIVIFNVWHDANNILGQWKGYFKGDTKNLVLLKFFTPTFSNYPQLSPESTKFQNINYQYADSIYSSSTESHGKHILLYDFSQYADNFNTFIKKYPFLNIIGNISAGIDDHSSTVFSYLEFKRPLINPQIQESSFQISVPYFETAGRYTNLFLTLYFSGTSIYFNWDAYYKGDVTNNFNISIDRVNFQNNIS